MTVYAIVAGTLFRAPEQKTSKAGRPFVFATLKSKEGDATSWIKLLVFSESAGAELTRLSDGDAISAQGTLKIETYEKDGLTKVGLTIVADHVLALRQQPRERKLKAAKPDAASPGRALDRHSLDRHGSNTVDEFGDMIPF